MTNKNNSKRSGMVRKSRATNRTKTNKTNKRNIRQKSMREIRNYSAYRNRRYIGGGTGSVQQPPSGAQQLVERVEIEAQQNLFENLKILACMDNTLSLDILKQFANYTIKITKEEKENFRLKLRNSFIHHNNSKKFPCGLKEIHPNINIKLLNIDNEGTNIIYSNDFPKGNMHRYKEEKKKVEPRIKLINLFEISFTPLNSPNTSIKSLRYGTPFQSKDGIEPNLYKEQCELIKNYLNSPPQAQAQQPAQQPVPKKRRGIVISLIDMIHGCVLSSKDKCKEGPIIEIENSYYKDMSDIIFINMSININVNTGFIGASCNTLNTYLTYCENVKSYLTKLKGWCDDVKEKSQNIKHLLMFWDEFSTNVTNNEIPASLKKYCDDVKADTLTEKQAQLPNEVCRLIMFCYISLIIYELNIVDSVHEYVLMYHCKSGQDRTGTFYAINQMVNEITNTYYSEIVHKISQMTRIVFEGPLLSKGKVFKSNNKRYFKLYNTGLLERYAEDNQNNVRGSHYIGKNTNIDITNNTLSIKDTSLSLEYILSGENIYSFKDKLNLVKDKNVNAKQDISFKDIYDIFYNPKRIIPGESYITPDALYKIIMKHMLFSYFVTYTSAGVPGIKWNLENRSRIFKTENRFSYLLLPDPETAKLFEGGSKLRGS
jgi:hypothetical protein